MGEKLRHLREVNKLSPKEVANILNVTTMTISQYENGDSQPSLEGLVILAKTYRTSTDYLLGIEKNPSVIVSGVSKQNIQIISHINDEIIKILKF